MTFRDIVPIIVLIALLAFVPVFITANTVLNFLVQFKRQPTTKVSRPQEC